MRLRNINITDLADNFWEFYPGDIMHVKIEEDNIQIMVSEGQLSPIKTTKLLRDDFDYFEWDCFINKLRNTFVL